MNEQKLTDTAVYPDGYLGMNFLQIIPRSRSLILAMSLRRYIQRADLVGDFLFSSYISGIKLSKNSTEVFLHPLF